MKTLRLTSNELKLFSRVPDSVKKSWKTETVVLEYKDSKDRMRVRLWQARVTGPVFLEILSAAERGATLTEMVAKIEDLDLSTLPEKDMHELLYALGPDVLSSIVTNLLSTSRNEKDIEQVAAYATARALFFAPLK